nr:PREDICTED: uncharacterized protein LOC106702544 [Latimeria chalumnae]|eukprot:XP_014340689.1 PREDICTED: uncharacterized protein LOC106702544 [Latimeria chalumnae]
MAEDVNYQIPPRKETSAISSQSCARGSSSDYKISFHQNHKVDVLPDAHLEKSSPNCRKPSLSQTHVPVFGEPPALHDLYHHELQKVSSASSLGSSFTIHPRKSVPIFSDQGKLSSRSTTDYHKSMFSQELDHKNFNLQIPTEPPAVYYCKCADGRHCRGTKKCSGTNSKQHYESELGHFQKSRQKFKYGNSKDYIQGFGDHNISCPKELVEQETQEGIQRQEKTGDTKECNLKEVSLPVMVNKKHNEKIVTKWQNIAGRDSTSSVTVAKVSMSRSNINKESKLSSSRSSCSSAVSITVISAHSNSDSQEKKKNDHRESSWNSCTQQTQFIHTGKKIVQKALPETEAKEKQESKGNIGEVDRSSFIQETNDIRSIVKGMLDTNLQRREQEVTQKNLGNQSEKAEMLTSKQSEVKEKQMAVSSEHLQFTYTKQFAKPSNSGMKDSINEENDYAAKKNQISTEPASLPNSEEGKLTLKTALALENMTTEEVSNWLKQIGFEKCIPIVQEHGFTGQHLVNFDKRVFDLLQLEDAQEREHLLSALYQELLPQNLNMEQTLDISDLETCLKNMTKSYPPSVSYSKTVDCSPNRSSCLHKCHK